MDDLTIRFGVARMLAAEAATLALRMRPSPGAGGATMKGVQDWLTEADGAVERMLSGRLLELFPQDGFQGEEGGPARPGAVRWVVDPIDGTSNFARGAARWCVSLGLVDDTRALLGVLVAPALGDTYAACLGRGATLNGQTIRAATTASLDRAIIEAGWSPRVLDADYLALNRRLRGTGAMLRNCGSGALGLAEVAAGRIDAYAELHINLWDVAAALAVLAESGAVTTPFGTRVDTGGGPILAAAPALAAELSRYF